MRFSLAGITWDTVAVNEKSKVIFVKRVPGISVVDWDVDFESELHTVLVRTMRDVLRNGEHYPYLSESCAERLREIRYLALGSGIADHLVTPLSDLSLIHILHDIGIIEDGGATFRFIVGKYGSGKSFLLQTIRNYATAKGFVDMVRTSSL